MHAGQYRFLARRPPPVFNKQYYNHRLYTEGHQKCLNGTQQNENRTQFINVL
jgi:hypothetical protein